MKVQGPGGQQDRLLESGVFGDDGSDLVVAAGSVAPAPLTSQHRVTITEVGVYIRDSYDFNGDQFLGYWDDSDDSVSMTNPLSGTKVSNADFRSWRGRTEEGTSLSSPT